jgi:hypothetical protein
MNKESICIDCGGKVLSRTRPKKRCHTCEDKNRIKITTIRKAAKRKLIKEQREMKKLNQVVAVGENNTDCVRNDAISKDTNYTDDIHEKQSLQKASD